MVDESDSKDWTGGDVVEDMVRIFVDKSGSSQGWMAGEVVEDMVGIFVD